ncbi:Yersinia protein of uncharacterised function (DUF3831) [Yersinia enterocolitica]|nr:Yersinia protein of uncharacterised function (DUF3831) [Yersinia enterocolitica]
MARRKPSGTILRRLYDLPVLSVADTLSTVWVFYCLNSTMYGEIMAVHLPVLRRLSVSQLHLPQ